MWDVKACRGCLATDCRLEKISDTYRRILPSLTGVDIAEGDGYPHYLCMECHMQVKKALAFRRKCRRANFVLKQIMIAKKQVSYTDITNVNRKKNNLTSSLITTTVSIDEIKSDSCLDIEIQDKEEMKLSEDNKGEEDNYLEEIDREENEAEDNDEDLANIDLDDIFKDLNEDHVDEESEVSEIEEVTIEAPKKKVKPERKEALSTYQALSQTVIKYVPDEQQQSNFKARMQMEPFKSALYKCSLCLTVYDELKALLTHTQVHRLIENGHYCNVCKCCFESEELLIRHKSYNHWYEYVCGMCNETHYAIEDQITCYNKNRKKLGIGAKQKKEYLSSLEMTPLAQEAMPGTLINWAGFKYQCKICNIGFLTKSTFKRHTSEHVPKFNRCVCDICGTHHYNRRRMEKHLSWYHSHSYTCKRCKQVFMNRFQAQHHVLKLCTGGQDVDPTPGSKFTQCTFCGKNYVNNKIHLHMYYVHYSEKYTHHCIICGLSFFSQKKLFLHQVNEHHYIRVGDIRLGDARYSCLQCNVRFVDNAALDVHISRSGHYPVKSAERTCSLCKATFDSEDELAMHATTCRLIEYPHKCIFCDEMMQNAVEYQRHCKRKHVGELPTVASLQMKDSVLCSLCGKTMHKTSLKKHTEQHTAQEMPYSCQYCLTKKVQLASALQYAIHMFANHATRPYHCARCPAKFKNRCECRVHILKTHAPVRPYTCGECGRTFSHADYLNDHSVKAHNINIKKTNKNIFLSKNMQGKIFVYPDMKLDVSLIGKDVIDLIDIYICDYMDENERILHDYTDYLIFEPCDETETEIPRTVNRSKRVKSIENGPKKKKIRKRKDDKIYETEVKSEEIAPDYAEDVDLKVKDENSLNKMSRVGNLVLDEHGSQHEVIVDENGDEFVMIDGVLYKLECSE